MKYTPSGQAVTDFSVACNRKWTQNGSTEMKETIWYNCTAWGTMAENVNKFFVKGQLILIEGRLKPDASGSPRIWTGADGTPHASYEITIDHWEFIGSKNDSAHQNATPDTAAIDNSTDPFAAPDEDVTDPAAASAAAAAPFTAHNAKINAPAPVQTPVPAQKGFTVPATAATQTPVQPVQPTINRPAAPKAPKAFS